MHTDEDLVRELEAAFREETDGLTYSGRVPSPRRAVVPWTAVPVAAAAAVVVVLPQLGGGQGTAPDPRPSTSAAPATAASASASTVPSTRPSQVVTPKLDLVAFEAAVADPSDDWPPLTVHIDVELPGDAEPVTGVELPSQVWIGTDPVSGRAMLWVRTPGRAGGMTMSVGGEGWSREQLLHLLRTGER